MLKRSIAAHTRIVVPTLDVFLKHYTDSKYVKADFENLVKNETLIPFFAFYHKLFIGKAGFRTKIKTIDTDLLFFTPNGDPIKTQTLGVYCCEL